MMRTERLLEGDRLQGSVARVLLSGALLCGQRLSEHARFRFESCCICNNVGIA